MNKTRIIGTALITAGLTIAGFHYVSPNQGTSTVNNAADSQDQLPVPSIDTAAETPAELPAADQETPAPVATDETVAAPTMAPIPSPTPRSQFAPPSATRQLEKADLEYIPVTNDSEQ